MKYRYPSLILIFVLLIVSAGCKKDPIINEIEDFEGAYKVDSIRYVSQYSNVLNTNMGEIILKKHPKTATIDAFGETTVVEPGDDQNTLMFSPELYQFNCFKRFAPSYYCLDTNTEGKYVAYWFPDLNKLRLTFWAICGNGQYRSVFTVKKLSGKRYLWTYVEANDLGASATASAMKFKELYYVTKK